MPTQTINGTTLYYTDTGRGLPLVLLHAFPVDGRMWEAQVEELSGSHRLITVDFRGFGRSGPTGPFTIADLADDVQKLLAALGALPCVLGGLSMGGYVAMRFAVDHPSDLLGMMLMDTKDAGDDEEQRRNRDRMIDLVRKEGKKPLIEAMAARMLAADTVTHRPQVMKKLVALMEGCQVATLEHALAALRDRPDMGEQLAQLELPTLIVVGDADAITPPHIAEEMHKKIHGSQLRIIRGAGHMAAMEQPAQVNQSMRQFLANLHTM